MYDGASSTESTRCVKQKLKFGLPEVNMVRWPKNKNCRNLCRVHVGVRKRCGLCGITVQASWVRVGEQAKSGDL